MKLLRKAAKVAAVSATFATSAFVTMPVFANGYTYDYYTDASDAAAATGLFGFSLLYICCICVIPLIINAVLAYVVYNDAKKNRVDNPVLWGILTLFFSLIGILVYFLAIRPEALKKNGTTQTGGAGSKDTSSSSDSVVDTTTSDEPSVSDSDSSDSDSSSD